MDSVTVTTAYVILALAAGFALDVAWHAMFHREGNRYRVPVVTVAAMRYPSPGVACSNMHGLVPPGGRCRVCGERIARTAD
jgi:hypothetical protein